MALLLIFALCLFFINISRWRCFLLILHLIMILLSVVDTVARIMVGKERPQSMVFAPPTGVFTAHTSLTPL